MWGAPKGGEALFYIIFVKVIHELGFKVKVLIMTGHVPITGQTVF